jgi:hypothetical protein
VVNENKKYFLDIKKIEENFNQLVYGMGANQGIQ